MPFFLFHAASIFNLANSIWRFTSSGNVIPFFCRSNHANAAKQCERALYDDSAEPIFLGLSQVLCSRARKLIESCISAFISIFHTIPVA